MIRENETSNKIHTKPCVSVIITTYRRDEYFRKALLSVLSQTYPNIEIIVVDDNADDNWNHKIESIINQEKPDSEFSIKYIKNESNLGVAASRNRGIKESNGEYITFLDDDDIYLENKVERQLDDMLSAEADFGITNLYLYNEDDKLVDKRVHSYIQSTDKMSLLRYHLLYHLTGTDTFMFKVDYINDIGVFPKINVGDEFYLMMRAINAGGKFCYSPHCYVKAYIHTGENSGLSSGYGKIKGENNLYREKKQYFKSLNKRDIRYIKVRHYAVLAYANLRMSKHPAFMVNALKAVAISPVTAVKIINNHR